MSHKSWLLLWPHLTSHGEEVSITSIIDKKETLLVKHCVPNKEYCQQKTKEWSSSSTLEVLFMFSFGVAHPHDPFSDCWAVFKSWTNSNLAKRKKEHFMARKRVFQIQHGCLDSTLYLGHWFIVIAQVEDEKFLFSEHQNEANHSIFPCKIIGS